MSTPAAIVCCLTLLCGTTPAAAAILDVAGPMSFVGASGLPELPGANAAIVMPPADVCDDAAHAPGMRGFDEAQCVVLPERLWVDGGYIPEGTQVSSHMIFLNTGPGDERSPAAHFDVTWVFDGPILGVMSSGRGGQEIVSSPFLGAPGTLYPTEPQIGRGLEDNNGGSGPWSHDGYTIVSPRMLRVGMSVTEPGDWIRVITRCGSGATMTTAGKPDRPPLRLAPAH